MTNPLPSRSKSVLSNRHHFVLIPGAWHGAWCWERIIPLLEARGHAVSAPELFGMGSDDTQLDGVTLARWADQISKLIEAQPEPVILVGHSRGGIVISEVAERVPDKIKSLVYLAAFLVRDGATLLETGASNPSNGDILLPGSPGTTVIATEAVSSTFYNTTEPEWQKRATSLVTPEPMRVFATPLRLSESRFGRVRRAYIETLQDRAVPIELQQAMQQALPCATVITLDTDHSPFYSAPELLVAALEEAVADH